MASARYRGLVFDMDGTLTVPSLDFQAMRREIGLTSEGDLAHLIFALPEEQQRRAWAVIERHEKEAIAHQRLQEGVPALLARCRSHDVRLGLITRNARESVDALCGKFGLQFL